MEFSLPKTIWVDWPALAAGIGIPVIWSIHVASAYVTWIPAGAPIQLPTTITLGLVAVLVWRLWRVARLFARGRTAPGEITGLQIVRDRGRLKFVFEHQGQPVESWTPVHKSKAVLALRPGQPVEVLFDPDNPGRAIVKHLYQSPK